MEEVFRLVGQVFLSSDFGIEIIIVVFLKLHVQDKTLVSLVLHHFGQQLILIDSDKEYILTNITLQTGRYTVHEILHFILLGLVLIDRHQVFSDVVLNLGGDSKTVHSCICVIETLLELNIFLVHFLNKHCHLTENVSVCHCRNNHHYHNNYDFLVLYWGNLIDTKHHNGVITHRKVLLSHTFSEDLGLGVYEVSSWYPQWVFTVESVP